MNSAPMTSHRLGRGDCLHVAAQPVRVLADQGTLWVTQDGVPADMEVEAGSERDFQCHGGLTIGTFGGEAALRLLPLPEHDAATALRRLRRWLGIVHRKVQP